MKPLPHNEELEKSILGYLMVYGDEAEKIIMELRFEYFYDSLNRKIIEKIFDMIFDGQEIDLMTVYKEFPEQLTHLTDCTEIYTPTSIQDQVNKLRELYQRRKIILESRRIERIGYEQEDFGEGLSESFERINTILRDGRSGIEDTRVLIGKFEKYLEENKGKELTGVSWGHEWIDEHTGGIRKGKTYRIGGLSGAGKTSFIYEVIIKLLNENKKVMFFTLENESNVSFENMLSTVQRTNPRKIQKGFVKADVEYLKSKARNLLIAEEIFSLAQIKREVLKHSPDVVILDYIGLVHIEGYKEKEMYDKYADEVKEFVQRNKNIAWIDLSNLNKSDNEATIREYKGFNGSAKLRNNTDFGMHIFPYKAFSEHKNKIMNMGTEEAKKPYYGKKALTFLISKNRLGDDDIHKHYVIDYNKGIRFTPATEEQISLWENSI